MSRIMRARKQRDIRARASRREQIIINLFVICLAIAVLICAAMLVPPLWMAVVNLWQLN
jgi:hypothetical protein